MKSKLLKKAMVCLGTLTLVASPLYTSLVHAAVTTSNAESTTSSSSNSVASKASSTSVATSSRVQSSSSAVTSSASSSSKASSSSQLTTAPKMIASNDGNNLYITMTTGSATKLIPTSFTGSYDGKQLTFNLSGTKDGLITVSLNGTAVGTGQVSSAGTAVKATISLAKTGLKDVAGKTMQISGGSATASTKFVGNSADSTSSSSSNASTATSEDKTTSSSSSKDESTDAVSQALKDKDSDAKKKDDLAENNNANGDFDISIDGDFDDWDDVLKSTMTVDGDNDNLKYVALVADSNNVYFYVKMQPVLAGGYTSFQPAGYVLTVGGKPFYISFNNNQTVNLDVGKSQNVSMNIYSPDVNVNLDGQASVSNQSIDQKNGDGSTVKGHGYVLECSIPIKDLKGISDTSDQTITLENSNLWTGKVTTTGGSTGPVLLASTGVAIAGLSVYKLSRKKRGVGISK